MDALKPLDSATPLAERRTLIAEFLSWLADPASQPRQTGGHLYDEDGGCCAMEGLGEVLVRHGYARKQDQGLEFVIRGQGDQDWPYRNSLHLPGTTLKALGLGTLWKNVVEMNDEDKMPFALIGAELTRLGLHVPAEQDA